ncbi:MAG TPA: class I SAM-dependent methyltransferase [Rhodothermales bacterium]|nr:class I SAM-dependent methyltransferase [Rhodothermales bacterium]
MSRSRAAKLRHFYSLCGEDQRVLDVGVSGLTKSKHIAENYFLQNFPYKRDQYTGLGIEDLSAVREAFPGMRFVEYDGRDFPFADSEFDWAFSNAVVEHVGDYGAQLHFVNEMLRVAESVFFTTPNRFFPIETHSNLPLLHWNRSLFNRWKGKHRPGNQPLELLSFGALNDLMQRSQATYYEIFRNRLCGWTMTFTVVARSYGSAISQSV